MSLLVLLLIPITSGVIGWLTNWLAVKMMFYPIKFVGIGKLGWQGVIPSKATAMAEIEVELVLNKLLKLTDLMANIDDRQFIQAITPRLKQTVALTLEDAMSQHAPDVWAHLPLATRQWQLQQLQQAIPEVVKAILHDVKQQAGELVDIRQIVLDKLEQKPELINKIFLQAGDKEFPFIERSGFIFGFLFGLPTMALWWFWPHIEVLVVAGLLVGYLTNYLALYLIFEPKYPRRFGPWRWQGLFLQRQAEVANTYSRLIQQDLINAQIISDTIFGDSVHQRLLQLYRLHLLPELDRQLQWLQTGLVWCIGAPTLYKIRERSVAQLLKDAPYYLAPALPLIDEQLAVADNLALKMRELSPEQFEDVLRPAYQQDEWKLILVGALLGAVAGVLQFQWLT